jgi:hypothetical protein
MAQSKTSALVPMGGAFSRQPATPLPALDIQHLWFRAADRRTWKTLAVVPVDDDVSTLPLARSLAQMAAHQAGNRVLLVNAAIKDCVAGSGRAAAEVIRDTPSDGPALGFDFVDFSVLDADEANRAVASSTQLLDFLETQGRTYDTAVFATDALLLRTPAIPLVRGTDATVICVRVGHTPLPDVRKLVKVIGRERILGSIALRPHHEAAAAPSATAAGAPRTKLEVHDKKKSKR